MGYISATPKKIPLAFGGSRRNPNEIGFADSSHDGRHYRTSALMIPHSNSMTARNFTGCPVASLWSLPPVLAASSLKRPSTDQSHSRYIHLAVHRCVSLTAPSGSRSKRPPSL